MSVWLVLRIVLLFVTDLCRCDTEMLVPPSRVVVRNTGPVPGIAGVANVSSDLTPLAVQTRSKERRRISVVAVLGCRSLPPAASPISRKAPVLGFVDVSVVTGLKALSLSSLLFSCPSCCIRRYHVVAIVGTVR